MTLDEFIASAKAMPKGYLVKLAEVSGYYISHVRLIVSGKCNPREQTLADLVASLGMAAKKQEADIKALYFNGLGCRVCGNTLRYLNNSECVKCGRKRVLKYHYKKRGML